MFLCFYVVVVVFFGGGGGGGVGRVFDVFTREGGVMECMPWTYKLNVLLISLFP